ncbi:helical backbone metal receptor [Filibacter tadaridae]|uniref:Vitamin B12-transporter protein BtuF n=1 Tax=Filibacter tadaridae TaxID=2483811 RepID=A0A3P5XE78_9BACL|nr:helical backbone metal receptor [Filibacter tadaridae]VDC25854.1 vitamin B12-transporter protein BtuF [Filibacter tadaridae]
MKREVVDHLGRTVTYEYPPKRIISLCPGITETLFVLQLENEIVGRTRFCIFPKDKVKNVPAVAGTKDIKLEAIHEVKPDLIIVEKEENTKEIVETLEQYYPVFVAEVQTVDEAYRMIRDMGQLTDREKQAVSLVESIQDRFESFPSVNGKRAAYVIWKKPYMVVGKDTYIQSILERMGFVNPFAQFEGRYPVVTAEDFQQAKLDYVLLASEPYPYKEKHKAEFQAIMPDTLPMLIDGEMFWYGAKMVEAVDYFKEQFHSL